MALIVNPQDDVEATPAATDDVAARVVLGKGSPDLEPEAPPPAWGTDEPEQGDAADDDGGDDGVVLFELDGVKYFMPRKPGPNVGVGYLRDVSREGESVARARLLERFIGPDGMDALADYEDLTDEDLEAIWARVDKHVLGGVNRGNRAARRAPADRRAPRTSPAGKTR